MTSIAGKKRGKATCYYLVESARVNGKPRIVSQEYLGTAEELAAAMRGGGWACPAAPSTGSSGRSLPPGACWKTSASPGSSTR